MSCASNTHHDDNDDDSGGRVDCTPLERLNRRELIEQLRYLQSVVGVRQFVDADAGEARPPFANALGHYAQMYALAPVGLLSLDAGGFIEAINATGAALLGWKRDWLLGQPFARWVVKDDLDTLSQHLANARGANDKTIGEVRLKSRNGRPVDVRLESVVIDGTNGESVMHTGLIDITELREAERKARLLQAELAHVTRLNTMGEIAASLAHELNQPLGTVKLYCDTCLRMLRQGSIDEARLLDILAQMSDAAQRGGEIISHLRAFLRKDGEPWVNIELNTLVEKTIALMEADARDKGSTIRLALAPDLPCIHVDRIHIEQVLLNLIRNSVEALIGAGTAIRKVTISTRQSNDTQLEVSVADTGPGLTARGYVRAFEPFYSTKSSGMGMGLAISRSMVEAHTGRLWGEPGVKGGAVFSFTLPVARAGHSA